MVLNLIISLQIAVEQHTVGIETVLHHAAVGVQRIERPGQLLPVLFAPNVKAMGFRTPLVGGKQHQRLLDFSIDFIPAFQEQTRAQTPAGSDPSDDGSDDAGAAFEIILLQQGVDQSAFPGFNGSDHGDAHDMIGNMTRDAVAGLLPLRKSLVLAPGGHFRLMDQRRQFLIESQNCFFALLVWVHGLG